MTCTYHNQSFFNAKHFLQIMKVWENVHAVDAAVGKKI